MKSKDLLVLINEVENLTQQNNLPLVTGNVEFDQDNVIRIFPENEKVVDFVSIATKINAPFIYITTSHIDKDQYEDHLLNLKEDEDDNSDKIKEIKSLSSEVGFISDLEIGFFTQNGAMNFIIYFETELHKLLFADDEDLADYDDDYDEDEDTSEEYEELKGILANDPKFQNAINHHARILITNRLLKSKGLEYESYEVYNLSQAANTLFNTDIKPIQEEKLADQAQALLDQGFKKNEIAKKLNISPNRLRKYI